MLFFFDIDDGGPLPDAQGLELPDLDAAKAHALDIAMTYLRQDSGQFWHEHEWSLEIRQANGPSLYRLGFRLTRGRTILPHPQGVYPASKD